MGKVSVPDLSNPKAGHWKKQMNLRVFLNTYLECSGFSSIDQWIEEIKRLNRGRLPDQGFIYFVKLAGAEVWFPSWDNMDYGPYGNKACNLCVRHLKCPNERIIFREKSLGENHLYCIRFGLSKTIEKSLKRKGFWNKIKVSRQNP